MEFLTGIGTGVLKALLARPEVQAMVMAAVVSVTVERLKGVLKDVDAKGVPAEHKNKVQLAVLACSFLANLGNLALQGQLGTLDPTNAVNFVVNLVATHLLANGVHSSGKAVKSAVTKAK